MGELRHAVRLLFRAPLFTGIVVLTLALGIGANTAIFTVVDQVILRPLPLPHGDELVRIQEMHGAPLNLTGGCFRDLCERARAFDGILAYRVFSRNITDARQSFPEQVDAAYVSPDFFRVVATTPASGRAFSPDEFREHAPAVVLLSDRLWKQMFSADRSIVGRTIVLDGREAEVAGVMPAGFSFPEDVQAWMPLTDDLAMPQNRRAHLFQTIGRLTAGVSLSGARAELQAVGHSIETDHHDEDPGLSVIATGLQESMVGDVRPALLILLGAVGFVLLIACANVMNLLLARGVTRQRDLAIRTALGAGRLRLIRQLMTESTLLAVTGGTLGVAAGQLALAWTTKTYPGGVPQLQGPGLDWRIVLFAVFASLASAVLAGLMPAWQFSHVDPMSAINATARGSEGRSGRRLRSALLVAEMALAVVLLTGAGLLIRSFLSVQRIDAGYDASNLAVIPISLPSAKYDTLEKRLQFTSAAMDKLRAVAGVRSVAATGVLPLRPAPTTDFELAGKPHDPQNEPVADVLTITPEYLQTMRIPLLAGRAIGPGDTRSAPVVALISKTMVDRYYAGENPIGQTVIMKDWGDPLAAQIVGVVGDVRQQSMETAPMPAVYFSYAQFSEDTLVTYLLAKTDGDPSKNASAMREQIWAVDRQQPVQVTTMEHVLADSLARRAFMLTLFGSFAAMALLLAMIGVGGVVSYSVSQREREFGIRMAVGAQRSQVLGMVLGEGAMLTVTGVVAGLIAAFALTRTLRSLLFAVSATDPLTYAAVCGGLVLLAIAACLAPAYRATRVDPMEALRYE